MFGRRNSPISRKMRVLGVPYPFIAAALIALCLQTLVVQTHIHLPRGGGTALALITQTDEGASAPDGGPADRYPAGSDPSNCPLCRELVHGTQFVTPPPAEIAFPIFAAGRLAVYSESPFASPAPAHGWQSRAPPQA